MVALDTDGFDEFAVPLDLLLTRPVFGLAERITPDMSWRRFAPRPSVALVSDL